MSTSLVSPGVQVPVVDETQYTTAPLGTVPFILVATAQDKVNQSNTLAPYTTANNAGQLWLETSQRSLVNDFGAPIFQNVQGTPVNASELNEYGLMTAYSTLGVSDSTYIMRAPIDLNTLEGSLVAPVGTPASGTVWFDTAASSWGLFDFNSADFGFSGIVPTNASGNAKLYVITSLSNTVNNAAYYSTLGGYNQPSPNLGKPGDYAVVPVNSANPVWYLSPLTNTWVLVGSASWQSSVPAVIGSAANPVLAVTANLVVNGSNIVLTSTAGLANVVATINAAAVAGVGAAAVNGHLALTANSSAVNSAVVIGATSNASILSELGLTANTYYAASFQASPYTNVPQWNTTDAAPAPTNSVWLNTSDVQGGANISLQVYNAITGVWSAQAVPVANNDAAINFQLDPINGGVNIAAGSYYLNTGAFAPWATSVILERVAGPTEILGFNPSGNCAANSTLIINTAVPGEPTFNGNVTVTVASGGVAANIITAINSASIPGISAGFTGNGLVYIENVTGATFYLYDGLHTPLANVGMYPATTVPFASTVSNWKTPSPAQVVSATAPTSDPANAAIWFYDDPTQADILINTGRAWASYATVSTDARGWNLTLTDPAGPIVSASVPTMQSDGTALVSGDLWINTSDFASLPNIWRYNASAGWTQINTEDHTSVNGIVFADARWSAYGNVDPGAGVLTPISTLVTINAGSSPNPAAVLDSDAPSYALFPRGTLLFNTRRSGMNVKQFRDNYLTADAGQDGATDTFTSTWVTISGNNEAGVAYQGSAAQRNVVVESLISAVTNSAQLLDSFYNFNLISCPGYPEVLPTLVTLNENRGETAFIVADSPLTLVPNANTLNVWANNLNGATTDGVDGLVTNYDYAAVYYPAGLTTDLSGNSIVVPASYMALPTIILSDAISYPWFAPAGETRGVVTNVSSIGYVDETTGNYYTNSISQPLRDVLYPAFVNPISNFTSGGIELYGQKTRSGTSTELSRINVARLVIYLRIALQNIGRQYVFEQNDPTTRSAIAYQIGEFLKTLQTLRAISDYAVVCNLTNNSPATIDANELYVDVAVAPITSAEFIYIPVTLVGQGVLSGSTVTSA